MNEATGREEVVDRESARIIKEALNEGIQRFLEGLIFKFGEGVNVSVEAEVFIRDLQSGVAPEHLVPFAKFQVFGEVSSGFSKIFFVYECEDGGKQGFLALKASDYLDRNFRIVRRADIQDDTPVIS